MTFTDADFVPAEPATAAFTYFVDGPTVLFNNNSLFADTYAWDFGDGYSSTIEDPVHTYAVPGVYNVCLTASNDLSTDEFCQDVTVVLDCSPFTLGGTAGQLQSDQTGVVRSAGRRLLPGAVQTSRNCCMVKEDHHHFECETYRADTRYYL